MADKREAFQPAGIRASAAADFMAVAVAVVDFMAVAVDLTAAAITNDC